MDQVTSYSPCWIRGSKIEEIVWIGKDVLAWCTGVYIVFFHIDKRQQTLQWCWNDATGDGARCISGHVSLPIFAFSERSLKPRILVFEYPSMTRICECVGGYDSGYLAIAFTPDDYLVSLGSYPNFPMIIWCWRTGTKIVIVDTPIRDEIGQIIKITQTGRTVIGQMGKTCGKLLTWELDIIDKIHFLKDHEIKLPQEATICGIDWCPNTPSDPLLAITDIDGHVYLSNYDGTNILRVVFSQRCGICTNIEIPVVCWFHGGIILKTTFCQIRYFKKKPKTDVWHKLWYIKAYDIPYILIAHPSKNWLFYYTLEGYLMQIIFPEGESTMPTIHTYLYNGGKYRFVDFLHPWCHHLAATDDLKELSIFESYSGSEVSKVELDIEGNISALVSHPDDPLIVVVSDHGEMVLLGVTDPEQPMILVQFRLQRTPLDLIKFSHCGKFLIVAQKETGNCYCVNLQRDAPWEVVAQLQTKGRLVDVVLYDDEARAYLKVLVLIATLLNIEGTKYEPFCSMGQQLHTYNVSYLIGTDVRLVNEIIDIITLPAVFYELCHTPGDPQLLIGSLYFERQLYMLRLERFEYATLTDAVMTGHHVRLAHVFADRRWIVTCAYDGLVIIHDRTIRQVVAVIPMHHRLDSGNRKAIISSDGDTVIALGHDGSLVAMRLHRESEKESTESPPVSETRSVYSVDYEQYMYEEERKEKILSDYASLDPAIRASLTRARINFPATDEEGFETWEEWQQNMQLREETRFYAAEKAAITKDLEALKDAVRQLLDANETYSEIERLPVSAFDLDKAGRDQKLKTAEKEREDTRMELEDHCASMDDMVSWIKKTFWDPQIVLGRSIFSFRDNTEVTNYPLTKEDPYFKDHLQFAQFTKNSIRSVIYDTFQPWYNYTEDQLQKFREPIRKFERRRTELLLEEKKHEIDPEELEELRAVGGMTTHQFVEQSPFSQMESYGFEHLMLDNRYLMHDCRKLHVYFNKLFDDMYATKERETNVILERNEHIRYIDSELRIMFDQSVPQVPVDPQWHPKEKVESIIQVLQDEVKAKPYVSPSQQEILDRQAVEAERIRQLLLADDFRERALIKMMDGMLEIRWEDILKVDVRKPACMLEKQPDQYTPDDIAAIRKYEMDVESLQQERDRYRQLLEADYAKINGLLQEDIDKFDAKLNEFFQLKLRVDAAINQLKLRHIRDRTRILARVESMKEEDEIKKEIFEKLQYEITLEKHIQKLNDVYQDMLAHHDALYTREKEMMKFQPEFALSKVNVELLERQYKRRPRVFLKNIAASDLLSLADYLAHHTKPAYFPTECADYSKILENLDVRPSELSQSINVSHWDQLTQSRRQKINIELKIKAQQLKIAAMERTISAFEGKLNACKSNEILLRDRLRAAREKRIMHEQDAQIQLVLKRGQVELELRGEWHDAVNAVLVPREEIERVNEHICIAGARKIDVLKRIIDFRHEMLSTEWEHRCLRTRFNELKEDLHSLKDVTVTRDMHTYLRRKAKGLQDDKTETHLEKEIEAMKKSLDKVLAKEMNKLEKLRQKIARTKKKNAELDRAITEMNVARWELEYQRDVIGEIRQREHTDQKMRLFKQRSDLIRKLQENYTELLALQTEYELLRLRAYPLGYFQTPVGR
ncbi:PREDICTED: cilia- and flagella-associated protein 43-like [Trachymyrmex septentrionalis]|uniref:cilia- and flagella-associated protein 43-like n=1 Tax=Trachymyrmex septentrionalis TaxID=34720 RepID=UPI00084F1F90|nr:PREDICTED: cilia- and flagella-associated protein 43-like [Trachymyrmex septentrionalis]